MYKPEGNSTVPSTIPSNITLPSIVATDTATLPFTTNLLPSMRYFAVSVAKLQSVGSLLFGKTVTAKRLLVVWADAVKV